MRLTEFFDYIKRKKKPLKKDIIETYTHLDFYNDKGELSEDCIKYERIRKIRRKNNEHS